MLKSAENLIHPQGLNISGKPANCRSRLALFFIFLLSSCAAPHTPQPSIQSISEKEYYALCHNYELFPEGRPGASTSSIPFKTVAEANVYLTEVSKYLRHENDGEALQKLALKYETAEEHKERTSLKFVRLRDKTNIFEGSNYEGYRYAIFNLADLGTAPRIMEVIVDKNSNSTIEGGSDEVPKCLYTSLTAGITPACSFTGYAFLYNNKYRFANGKSYLNGYIFANKIKLEKRRDGVGTNRGVRKGTGTDSARSGGTANRCVRYMDYHSGGHYITSVCLEYVTDGGGWGGIGDGGSPNDVPDDGSGSGGNGANNGGTSGTGMGSSSGGPNTGILGPQQGVAVITQPFGAFPGQSVWVVLEYDNGTIMTLNPGMSGFTGMNNWVQIGNGTMRSYIGNTYTFDIAFRVETHIPGGVVSNGTPHLMFGTYDVATQIGALTVPRYW